VRALLPAASFRDSGEKCGLRSNNRDRRSAPPVVAGQYLMVAAVRRQITANVVIDIVYREPILSSSKGSRCGCPIGFAGDEV